MCPRWPSSMTAVATCSTTSTHAGRAKRRSSRLPTCTSASRSSAWPALHLSAEELRAYIAQTRAAEVNTSLATQLFVAHPRAKPEPPTRLVRMAETRAVLGVARDPAPGFARPGDATRTCYAPPAQLA